MSSYKYQYWTDTDVSSFVDSWAPRNRGWFVCMCDHLQNKRPVLITLPSGRQCWACCECAGDMFAEQDMERQLDAKEKTN